MGEKALGGYLGPDRAAWAAYDACALIAEGARVPDILVDQGTADQFLADQLKPELLEAACRDANIPLTLNRRRRLRPFLFFYRELHRRSPALACGATRVGQL